MATFLVLTFPLGRYHATPWGRHVNEGAVELPPSPWRLLRMLYAVWRTRAPDLDTETVHELLAALAVPPTFHVPRHALSHTRHYYPDNKTGTDRTLDAFAAFETGADLAVEWPFDLPATQHAALERLAGSIPYFGRADSVCTGSVPATWTPDAHERWTPLDIAESVDPTATVTAVLASEPRLEIAALLAAPAEVRKAGLPIPTGSRLVGYERSSTAPAPLRRSPVTTRDPVTAVRFSVLQAGLPPETDALVYTDLLRQAAIKALDHRPEGTVLGGRTANGHKATSDHSHAHFLPLTSGRRLTGLLVWAPGGLPADEVKALASLRKLYTGMNDSWRATLRIAGIGNITDQAPELVGPSTVWQSATPFTPARFPKRNQTWTDFIAAQVQRELSYRHLTMDCTVTQTTGNWVAFRRYRPSARNRHDHRQGQARQPSAMLQLTFTKTITGPLSLGHLAHFGLGLFTPNKAIDHGQRASTHSGHQHPPP